jgi:Tfp pilus assembly protein FimT
MQTHNGVTLPELLITTAILMILAGLTMPAMTRFLDEQASVARANTVVGLLREARASAAARGPVMVCAANSDCRHFDGPHKGLKLVHDRNNNRRHDSDESVLKRVQLAENESIQWRSFRMKPWLRFSHRGVAWYQNGHFLVCHAGAARKVIISTQGRARVAPAGKTARQRCP